MIDDQLWIIVPKLQKSIHYSHQFLAWIKERWSRDDVLHVLDSTMCYGEINMDLRVQNNATQFINLFRWLQGRGLNWRISSGFSCLESWWCWSSTFRCKFCKKRLGEKFYVKQNAACCPECYNTTRCAVCSQIITEGHVTFGDSSIHTKCMKVKMSFSNSLWVFIF